MNPSHEELVHRAIAEYGPGEAFRRLIEASDSQLRSADLDHGLEFAAQRNAIFTGLMASWAEGQREDFGYKRPFAVVALGGTGREEMTPCSDTDFAFLFDDAIEGNSFLIELQRQVTHTGEFRDRHGFRPGVLPFNLEDLPGLDTVQRNSFLDMKPVYDPDGLVPRFRKRIRTTFDPFEHFLHVSSFWRGHWGEPKGTPDRLDKFDIKKDGLRVFLAGIWTMAGREFVHSHDIYRDLDDPRDLEAYSFLLRIRSYVHMRRGTRSEPSALGYHDEDVLEFDDFSAVGALLGPEAGEQQRFEFENEVRSRLLSARRRVDRFTRGIIGRALKAGREIRPGSAINLGTGGLHDTAPDRDTDAERSRAALAILHAAQRYELPIDPSELETTFRDAGDWLVPVPELSTLFYETRGSLADSFHFLSQLDGAQERLFPGYEKFEATLDERIMTEQAALRGAHEREKIRAVENYYAKGLEKLKLAREPSKLSDPGHEAATSVETALLDPNHLAAVKLALKTKRLPETPDDLKNRADESRPIHARFSSGLSGIPLETYYRDSFQGAEFPEETLDLAEFLVRHRNSFKAWAHSGLISPEVVDGFIELCGSEERLRALYVFTCADRVEWESEDKSPTLWFNIRQLFCKARLVFHPDIDPTEPLAMAGYTPDELAVLKDFGNDFFQGVYRHYAIRFGVHLLRILDDPDSARPRVGLVKNRPSLILGIAVQDHPGMAASITGALWHRGLQLEQAHLFSAMHHGLALDFFHLDPETTHNGSLLKELEDEIHSRRFLDPNQAAGLPEVATEISLTPWQRDLFCLRAETSGDVGALVYELTWKVFRLFGANIFGLRAQTGRNGAYVSVYHNLPSMSEDEAHEIIRQGFQAPALVTS